MKPINWKGKYEKRFIRMMAKIFSTIAGLIVILVLVGVPTLIVKITSIFLFIISFIFRNYYWSYLEGLELEEKLIG